MRVIPDVPQEMQLNYYVGSIVISDSFAEHEARVLWNVLEQVGLVTGKRPEMFGRLLPALEDAVNVTAVPDEFCQIALSLFELARKWHKYRRDLVHDLLVTGWGRGNDVLSATRKHPPRPMSEIIQCSEELRTVSWRLRGLYIIAPYWLDLPRDKWEEWEGWEDAGNLRSWTRVAMGHIADHPNSIVGSEGPAPEPPDGWDTIVTVNRARHDADEVRRASADIFFEEDSGSAGPDGHASETERE